MSALGFTALGTRVQAVGKRWDLALQRIGMNSWRRDANESHRGEVARRDKLWALLERAPDARTAGIGVPMARHET